MKLSWPGIHLMPTSRSPARQRWRFTFAALVVTGGAACTDGYPQKDVAVADPLDMTQDQRLAHMNALGGKAHPDRRWSYDLLPGCVLRIDFDGEKGPRPAIDIPLPGASIKVTTNKHDETFDVEVKPLAPGAPAEVAVLEAQKWVHAISMSRVLRVVETGCADE